MVKIATKGIVEASTSEVKIEKPISFYEKFKDKTWSWNIGYLPDGKLKVSSSNAPGEEYIVSKEEFDKTTNKDNLTGIS